MRCLTVVNPAKILDGIVADFVSREKQYMVRLGLPIKLANSTNIPLFKENPPDLVISKNRQKATINEAYPVETELKRGPCFTLARPAKLTPDILLVRFNMGAQAPDHARASVWPERGNPTIIAFTTVTGKVEVWPDWAMDSLWTCAPGDCFLVRNPKFRYHVRNEHGNLVILNYTEF